MSKQTNKRPGPEGQCMWGRIYSDQRCPVCKSSYIHDENRRGLFCGEHPDQQASGRFIVRFGRKITKRTATYLDAERLLISLRWEVDQGKFDVNDHQAGAPNGFRARADRYIEMKEQQGLKSISNTRNYMKRASEYFEDKNVKEFTRADIREFLYSLKSISEKTRHNYMSCLRDFFRNLWKDNIIEINQIPKMPDIDYELGYRKIVDIETQKNIISRVKELTDAINPKIWLGIDMLALYTNIRPQDLLNLTEGDIDAVKGILYFKRPTKKKGQLRTVTVRLIDEHILAIREIKNRYPAMPDIPFFRHTNGISGVKADRPFGAKYFYKWWVKACDDLGISGLDLYGGTRHSTVTALAKEVGEDAAKKASGHDTSKAFERYCQFQDDDTFEIVQVATRMKGKIYELDKKKASE